DLFWAHGCVSSASRLWERGDTGGYPAAATAAMASLVPCGGGSGRRASRTKLGCGRSIVETGELRRTCGKSVVSSGKSAVRGLERLWITLGQLVLGFPGTRSPLAPAKLVAGAAAQISGLDRKRWLSC